LNLLREPLIHFLILGAALFVVFGLTSETDPAAERRIVVTASQVDQLASRFSRTWLRDPTPRELEGLVTDYIRNEIFYRESLAMGLAQDDPYVRSRLTLKLEVLLDDLSTAAEPAEEELARFLEQQPDRFIEPARLSFRQVYVNPDRHAEAAAEAVRLLEALRAGADPGALGDVSLLAGEFEDAGRDRIERDFGNDFAEALAGLEPGRWRGPVASPFGLHLVLLIDYRPARRPPLAEVREAVLAEWRDQRRRESREQAYERLRERYEIILEPDAQSGGEDEAVAAAVDAAEDEAEQGRP